MTLPYAFDALEPYIDTHTMGLHYHKHYATYLKNLNLLLKQYQYDFKQPFLNLLNYVSTFPSENREAFLFNLGGVLNHELYFATISDKKNHTPTGELKKIIDEVFGTYDNFKAIFKSTALSLKGSGYTALVWYHNSFQIMNITNQNSPYFYQAVPIMILDLWEHAYYINYENDKARYIDNYFEIVDFEQINKIWKESLGKNIKA